LCLAGLVLLATFLALPAHAVPRRVFVTSTKGTADLSSWPEAGGAVGLAAGDAICRARATASGFSNATSYRAWLSSGTSDAFCHVQGRTGKIRACSGAPVPVGPLTSVGTVVVM